MIVTILIAQEQTDIFTKTIWIRDFCPTCGKPRVKARHGTLQGVDAWRSVCGHKQTHDQALTEYMRRMHFCHRGRGDKYQPSFESFFPGNRIIKTL